MKESTGNETLTWNPTVLEQGRRFLWDKDLSTIYCKRLGIRRARSIIDVGCGTGFFTRLISENVSDESKVYGIDLDMEGRMLRYAARLSKGRSNIRFLKGDIYDIPFPASFADVTVCNNTLWTLQEQLRALEEMKRVTREGGTVAALEPCQEFSLYYDEDRRINESLAELKRAWNQGVKNSTGRDPSLGPKLPSLFLASGMVDIKATALVVARAVCDTSYFGSRTQAIAEYANAFEEFNQYAAEIEPFWRAGGLTRSQVKSHIARIRRHYKNLTRNPSKVLDTGHLVTFGWILVTAKAKR